MRSAARTLLWSLAPVLIGVALTCDAVRGASTDDASYWPALVALLACWLVGVVLTARPGSRLPGWAFLGLATAVAWSAFTDSYADLALLGGRQVPAGTLLATFGDSSFSWWFVFLALVLQWTPPTRASGPARVLPRVTVGIGVAYQVLALVRSRPLDPPRSGIVSPWAIPALSGPAGVASIILIYALGVVLLASVVVLVRSWRSAQGEARQQLLWLVAGAAPVAPVVVASFVASRADHNEVASFLLGAAMVTLVAGAALSVLRYRLYDVERVVVESTAYAIASVAVVVVYLGVVLVIDRSTPGGDRGAIPVVAATLAGVAAARASYVWGRRAVSRRVNHTRFRALHAVRVGLAGSRDLDSILAEALGPGSRVVYPSPDGGWVTALGAPAEAGGAFVVVERGGHLVARLEYDEAQSERDVVAAVVEATSAEIDNVALRAELARQLALITESRARLETAHLVERRRIERDLHDGAQQRLLATALQLQSARVNGGEEVLRVEVDRAIADLAETVEELRSLAGGVQPASLASGGLLAAVTDLVARIPVDVRYDVIDGRFPAPVESAAWFVIAEGVANAVKHAGVRDVSITVDGDLERLRVAVEDLGVGRADAAGRGLQGLADRVAALRGSLRVTEVAPHGTRLEAVLPCGS